MCVCVCVCLYIYIYIYVCVCIYIYIYVCVYIYIYMLVYVYRDAPLPQGRYWKFQNATFLFVVPPASAVLRLLVIFTSYRVLRIAHTS